MSINIESINQIVQQRKQAADEAAKISDVIAEIEKICAEKGFANYAAFLTAANELEGGGAAKKGKGSSLPATAAAKSEKADRKKRVVVTEELVKTMKERYESRGTNSVGSIATALGLSVGTLSNYVKKNFVFAPKAKGRKPSTKVNN